ncbi:MAG: hypothetical protein R8K20_03065 [Gallionellaceae bacterium]
MNIKQDIKHFNDTLAIKIDGLLSPQHCSELIIRYENSLGNDQSDAIVSEIIKECADVVFVNDVDAFLTEHFQSKYQWQWPTFDVVDSSASRYKYSERWHLDGGIPKMLKLFVYLNPVAEHGGNTLIIDRNRTEKLKMAGELWHAPEERKEDLTPVLKQMGLDSSYLAYDFEAGDAVLFSPLLLVHRCLPPRIGKKRYTICFHVIPPI